MVAVRVGVGGGWWGWVVGGGGWGGGGCGRVWEKGGSKMVSVEGLLNGGGLSDQLSEEWMEMKRRVGKREIKTDDERDREKGDLERVTGESREGGREGGREGEREGGREKEREGGRKRGREIEEKVRTLCV